MKTPSLKIDIEWKLELNCIICKCHDRRYRQQQNREYSLYIRLCRIVDHGYYTLLLESLHHLSFRWYLTICMEPALLELFEINKNISVIRSWHNFLHHSRVLIKSEGMLLEILLSCFGLLPMTWYSINPRMHHKQIDIWVLHMRISVTFNFQQLPVITNPNSIHSL